VHQLLAQLTDFEGNRIETFQNNVPFITFLYTGEQLIEGDLVGSSLLLSATTGG
jgi:hypothetical protein